MNTIKDIRPYSIKPNEGFMWVAEILDKGVKNEYEIDGFDIDRDKLVNFGIVGLGNNLHYSTSNGIFNLNGRTIEFALKNEELEYDLTKRYGKYNDCICYQNYFQNLNKPNDGDSHFCGYSFGYKTKLDLMDLVVNFQPILVVNFKEVPYFKIRLVSNKDVKGKLLLKIDRKYGVEIDIDLKENISSEYEYYLK